VRQRTEYGPDPRRLGNDLVIIEINREPPATRLPPASVTPDDGFTREIQGNRWREGPCVAGRSSFETAGEELFSLCNLVQRITEPRRKNPPSDFSQRWQILIARPAAGLSIVRRPRTNSMFDLRAQIGIDADHAMRGKRRTVRGVGKRRRLRADEQCRRRWCGCARRPRPRAQRAHVDDLRKIVDQSRLSVLSAETGVGAGAFAEADLVVPAKKILLQQAFAPLDTASADCAGSGPPRSAIGSMSPHAALR